MLHLKNTPQTYNIQIIIWLTGSWHTAQIQKKCDVANVTYLCGFYGGLVHVGVAGARINAVGRVVLARVLRSGL